MDTNTNGYQPELFPCIRCGACCEKAPDTEELVIAGFIETSPSGERKCRHYDAQSRTCLIYHERPDICRSVIIKSEHYPEMPDAAFAKMSMQACVYLNEQREDYASANAIKKSMKRI